MSKFTNRQVTDQTRVTNFFSENASTTLNGSSPFVDGVTLSVTGVVACQTEIDGAIPNNSPIKLVITTTIGDISVPMLVRRRLDADGNHIVPSGTFNNAVTRWIAENPSATNQQFADWITASTTGANRRLIVRRRPYAGIASDGRRYPASLVEFNFVDSPSAPAPADSTPASAPATTA